MKILVTDGDSRSALAIARSLGKLGHQVHVCNLKARSLAGSSKYCQTQHVVTDPSLDRDVFAREVIRIANAEGIDVIIPPTDVSLLPISELRDCLPDFCRLPLPSHDAIVTAADKGKVTSLAEELGVPTPLSVDIERKDSVNIRSIQYPVVIKPTRSRVKSGEGWIFTGVDYAANRTELFEKLEKLPDAVYPVLLQERIKGPGIGVFYCYDNGRPVATFAHRRIHEKPPSGGVSVLRESVSPHHLADEYGRKLLEALNWHGVAMVEFKLDQRDDTPKLMEINGRFWGSLQLAVDSGVDFPRLIAQISAGENPEPVKRYELGVRSRWFWGEIDLFLLYLLKSAEQLQLPDDHPSRFRSALQVLNPFVRRQKFEILRLSDIRPWLYETRNWFSA